MSDVLAVPQPKLRPVAAGAVLTRAELNSRIKPFASADSFKGYKAFAIDVALYAAGIAAVVLSESLALKIAGGLLAGLGLVTLGSLSHEAAHRAVVKSRLGNKIIAVVSLTMILFNYRLWVYDHHVLHHGRTNVKENNFLSPITLAEYRELSPFRRALYRAYHSPSGAGILLYYLINRWPTVHYLPGAWLPQKFRASAWGYTALLTVYAAGLIALLVAVPLALGSSVVASLICGFVVPYVIWFTTFSMTAFLQHTNPKLRWYPKVSGIASPPEALSVQVVVPHVVNHVTHYVLEHPVHHVSAMVPHYRLKDAQAALADMAQDNVISMPFTLRNMQDVLRRCRLYDYEQHVWTDFEGKVTAIPLDIRKDAALKDTASGGLLPDEADPDSPGIFFPPQPEDSRQEPARAARRENA